MSGGSCSHCGSNLCVSPESNRLHWAHERHLFQTSLLPVSVLRQPQQHLVSKVGFCSLEYDTMFLYWMSRNALSIHILPYWWFKNDLHQIMSPLYAKMCSQKPMYNLQWSIEATMTWTTHDNSQILFYVYPEIRISQLQVILTLGTCMHSGS